MRKSPSDGYALLVVMLMLSLFVLSLAAAMPGWKTAVEREREAQMIDRGREYRTAIKRYFHKNGRYPATLDALTQKDGNNLRYLRQDWPDPLTVGNDPNAASDASSSDSSGPAGDTPGAPPKAGSWKLLHYGEAVADEMMDPPLQNKANGTSTAGGIPGLGGVGGTSAADAPGSGAGAGTGGSGSGFGSGSSSSFGSGFSGSSGAGAIQAGMPGTAAGAAGGIFGPAPGSQGTGTGLSGSSTGTGLTGGQTMGGGPIVGVSSTSKIAAVHSFNGYNTPDHWQFVYDFTHDQSLTGGTGGTGAAPAGLGAPPSGLGGIGGIGGTPASGGVGASGSTGSTGSTGGTGGGGN